MSTEMKKLIIGGTEYEIVDESGRSRISALEQGGGGSGTGLTQTEKNLLLTLFEKAAYAENDAGTAYTALSNLWAGYSVTWNGIGYTKSNGAASVESGGTFTSTVTANTGFTITNVTATMGGNTVQGAWSNGTVTIPNVTGDIVITVTTSQMTVSSISAVYTQSGTVYDTDSLDSLKSDLVVTATFMDSTTGIINPADYTLSGTLAEGNSTITVTYAGLTDTFSVTVSHADSSLYSWDFKTGLTDSKQGIVATTTATQTSGTGLVYDTMNQYTLITGISSLLGKTVEIDVEEIGTRVGGNHRRLFLFYGTNSTQQAGFICNAGSTWKYYSGSAWDTGSIASADASYFNGKTVKIEISATGAITVSRKTIGAADSTYEQVYASSIGAISSITADATHCTIGWNSSSDGLGNATISAMRIYG